MTIQRCSPASSGFMTILVLIVETVISAGREIRTVYLADHVLSSPLAHEHVLLPSDWLLALEDCA